MGAIVDTKTFTIERSTRTKASKEAVMRQLLDPATWPRWQMEIVETTGPERVTSGDVVQGRAKMLGFHVIGQSVAGEVGDGAFTEDVVVGVGMRISYSVQEVPGGSVITHRLLSNLPDGPLGRVLTFFLRRRLKVMQRVLLERLPREAEREG